MSRCLDAEGRSDAARAVMSPVGGDASSAARFVPRSRQPPAARTATSFFRHASNSGLAGRAVLPAARHCTSAAASGVAVGATTAAAVVAKFAGVRKSDGARLRHFLAFVKA